MGNKTNIALAASGGAAAGALHECFGTFVWYALVPFPVRMGVKMAMGAVGAGLAQHQANPPAPKAEAKPAPLTGATQREMDAKAAARDSN